MQSSTVSKQSEVLAVKKTWKPGNLLKFSKFSNKKLHPKLISEEVENYTPTIEEKKEIYTIVEEVKSILKTSSLTKSEMELSKKVQFSKEVEIRECISASEYDRKGDYVAKCLTSDLVRFIKSELNEVKKEMEIHELSKQNTQFYK